MAERAVSKRELYARVVEEKAEELARSARLPLGVMSEIRGYQAAVLRGVAIGLRAHMTEAILEVPIRIAGSDLSLGFVDLTSTEAGEQPEY